MTLSVNKFNSQIMFQLSLIPQGFIWEADSSSFSQGFRKSTFVPQCFFYNCTKRHCCFFSRYIHSLRYWSFFLCLMTLVLTWYMLFCVCVRFCCLFDMLGMYSWSVLFFFFQRCIIICLVFFKKPLIHLAIINYITVCYN